MSEKTNDSQELKELRQLKQMYQSRLEPKFEWSKDKKEKSLIGHYQTMLDRINKKIAKLENN